MKAEFEAGVEAHLYVLGRFIAGGNEASRSKAMAIFATMVGAVWPSPIR